MDWPNSPSMRATVGSATLHFTCASLMRFPWASRSVAKKPALSWTATVSPGGVTVTDATGPGLPGGVESTDESPASAEDSGRFGPVSSLQAAAVIAAAARQAASICRMVPPVRSERRQNRIPTDPRPTSHVSRPPVACTPHPPRRAAQGGIIQDERGHQVRHRGGADRRLGGLPDGLGREANGAVLPHADGAVAKS